MLALPLNGFCGGQNARSHRLSLPNHAPGNAKTQPPSIRIAPTFLKGHLPCHSSLRSSLNLPAGTLHRFHVVAVVDPKPYSPAGFRYKLTGAFSKVRNILHQMLGGVPSIARAQERPITTPTRWYCHKCNHGPYNIAAQPGCTNVINGRQCDHSKCHYCKEE